mmetsp:Transcript_13108/g.15399  ORF Transcript_13108/g.15399 Transcript_13108/m.15399 type:complete len:284 (+) Transcript_13108:125-976(+)|eukprot:CAMPEP_0198273590 /NCGR_PEP_ID=MMETSP1447-20131203/57361_1 /TAXON_ID=420782 /ORGANISM="Chaetoceros dichaeta, Strain CCMP1751" /LENGTH=283 /DNA_ID=CAMNT_0043967341 /DNA_START=35 /DNA_END=886 /DNA_ORIENTATION=+
MPEFGCNCCTFCSLLLVFAAATAGAIIYQDKTGNKIPFVGDNLPNITEVQDTFSDYRDRWGELDFGFDDVITNDGPNATGTGGVLEHAWDTNGKVALVNALTNDWNSYFTQAMVDWEESNVLTLSTTSVDPDEDCIPIKGKMKVCNGNYGNTGWEGINEILTSNSKIVSSVAKMNEYYLGLHLNLRDIAYKRQYTMCHEIGHGFGLPHLDENFNNEDLNSCMDYSQNPDANLKPNAQDYKNLNTLYGDGTSRHRHRFLRNTEKYNLNGEMVDKHTYILPAHRK